MDGLKDERFLGEFRCVQFGRIQIDGPTDVVRMVDFYDGPNPARGEIKDADLVEQFDRGMELGPWLDWVAERHPGLEWAAGAFGRFAA